VSSPAARFLLALAALPFFLVGAVLIVAGLPLLVAGCLLFPFPKTGDWPPIPRPLPNPPARPQSKE